MFLPFNSGNIFLMIMMLDTKQIDVLASCSESVQVKFIACMSLACQIECAGLPLPDVIGHCNFTSLQSTC